MPVFNFDFNRSCTRLDMSGEKSGIFTPGLSSLELKESDGRWHARRRLPTHRVM